MPQRECLILRGVEVLILGEATTWYLKGARRAFGRGKDGHEILVFFLGGSQNQEHLSEGPFNKDDTTSGSISGPLYVWNRYLQVEGSKVNS